MHVGRAGDRLRAHQGLSKDAVMPGWLSEARGTTGLMLETLSAMCRESIEQACTVFEMDPASAKAVGALTPTDIPALIEALGPGQVLGLRNTMTVRSALTAAASPELYGKGGRVEAEWGSDFGIRVCLWLQAMRRACREAMAEACVLYGLKPEEGMVIAEMTPAGLHTLMQKIAPAELIRFKDSTGLASMLRGLRGSEERALDVQLADRFAHSLRR